MPEETRDRRALKFCRPETSMNAYSNSVRVSVTPWDFRFLFGEIGDSPVEGQIPVYESVRVTMSPQHAKAFLNLLRKNMEKFEARYGEVKVPERDDDAEGQPEERAPEPSSAR